MMVRMNRRSARIYREQCFTFHRAKYFVTILAAAGWRGITVFSSCAQSIDDFLVNLPAKEHVEVMFHRKLASDM